MSSFSIALSGLTADSAALDVVGNNLANLNTTGYKDSNVSFYDLLQQSVAGGSTQIGGGVSAPQTERSILRKDPFRPPAATYDAAINGNGFFVVQNPAGQHLVYARRKFPARRQRQSGHRHRSVRARLDGAERRGQHQRPRSAISPFPPTRCRPPARPRICR